MRLPSVILLISLILTSPAWSQSYQFGNASFSGPGCSAGTSSAIVSPDGSSISFLFDGLRAEYDSTHTVNNTTCSIVVPVNVPAGYMIQASYFDFRGFVQLSQGSIRLVTSGFVGKPGLAKKFGAYTVINSPSSGEFYKRQLVRQAMPGRPKCVANNEVRVAIHADIISTVQPVLFSLDSADVGSSGGGLTVGLELVPCR